MNRLCVLALVSLTVLASVVAGQEDEALLGQLCSRDKKAPAITTLSQVKSIIESLRTSSNVECPAAVRYAIESLEPLISAEDVCSKQATDAMVDYWSKFINGRQKKSLPRQLRRFVIGLGLQTSRVCKEALVAKFATVEAEKQIKEEDFRTATRSIEASGQVKAIFGEKLELESLIFLAFGGKKSQEPEVLSLAPKQKKYFDLMRERCLFVFKPIYDALVLPAVRLAAIGFNYKDSRIVDELQSLTKTPQFEKWVNVIFACEPAVKFQTVLAPASKQDGDGNEVTATVLDEEDIAELKQNTGLTLEEPALTESVEYKIGAKLNDLIIDDSDAYLSELIPNYKRGLKETTKLRLKLMKRILPILKFAKKNDLIRVGFKKNSLAKSNKFGAEKHKSSRLLPYIKWLIIGGAITTLILAIHTPIGAAMWAAFGILAVISLYIILDYISRKLDVIITRL